MKAELISNYTIWTSYRYSEEINKELEDELKSNLPILSKEDLKCMIDDYFNYYLEIKINPEDEYSFDDYNSTVIVENINEIVEYFSYLIEPEKNVCSNCGRNNNDEHFQYCPNCGTKL